MKDFKEFEQYMHIHGKDVHEDIVKSVNASVEKLNIENPIEAEVTYQRYLVEIGFMKMIEQYHLWLNA